ncbi:glycosyltransferase [Cyclonatronum proteinivorum]|uniref:glycosyltransferase n=1 Tax=Cyclonatronum proteinivorum TaxID=1457365 RepID=UPI000F5412F7|nr:glycosyltransferase [Cyclonatronum proteinivorum]
MTEKQQSESDDSGKNVLLIAYYFPPMGGSGVQRPVKLAKYLPSFGWNPVILVPEPGAYYHFDESLAQEISELKIPPVRVKARTLFHAAAGIAGVGQLKVQPQEWKTRLLSFITSWFFVPDNKTAWIKPALEQAAKLIREHNIKAVIATAPPYSNLLIAARIREAFHIPVIMDFRDEWLQSHWVSYPTSWHFRRMQQTEQAALSRADYVTVVNEAYRDSISRRMPGPKQKRIQVIPNGYDPADFEGAEVTQTGSGTPETDSKHQKVFTLLHSGRFYSGIQPDDLLEAVHRFLQNHPEKRKCFRLAFQGGLTDTHQQQIKKLDLEDVTRDYGYLPHKKAVRNLMQADALFLTLGHIPQIEAVTPGKLFEYIGSGKPVLAYLPEGISQKLLQGYGACFLADLGAKQQQYRALKALFFAWEKDRLPQPDPEYCRQFSRIEIAAAFGKILDQLRLRES